ncbi:MAG: hypothetical protein LBP85_00870 [Prevotellaceae bacterium]|nr:hypothetical protein [Prevotellaceae bacterium]
MIRKMTIEIKNKVDGRASVDEFVQTRQELVHALAEYLIKHDLVEFEFKRGNLTVNVDII